MLAGGGVGLFNVNGGCGWTVYGGSDAGGGGGETESGSI